jgi:3-oxoacyl-[acyl-carrier-protein] synthase-3
VLVIGADTMSRIIDYTDRATCILFGDAAGAMIVEAAAEGEDAGFIDFVGEIDGSGGDYLKMPAGGSRRPASRETVEQRLHYVHQEGQQVFKYAVRKMYEACEALLARNGLTPDDVSMLIPHQANARIITASADRLGIPLERATPSDRAACEKATWRCLRPSAPATPWVPACGDGHIDSRIAECGCPYFS